MDRKRFKSFFYGYMLLIVSTVIRSYLSVLITWVFPYTPIWFLSIIMILVISYIVIGSFRVITGICFWGMVFPTLLIFTLYFPLQYAYWTNLLPVFNHSLNDYFVSAKNSVLMYTGPEFLLLYFPLLKITKYPKSGRAFHRSIQPFYIYLLLSYHLFILVTDNLNIQFGQPLSCQRLFNFHLSKGLNISIFLHGF
jgi:hypothetical protein